MGREVASLVAPVNFLLVENKNEAWQVIQSKLQISNLTYTKLKYINVITYTKPLLLGNSYKPV